MDTRIYEKGARSDKLWAVSVGLLFVLGLLWAVGA